MRKLFIVVALLLIAGCVFQDPQPTPPQVCAIGLSEPPVFVCRTLTPTPRYSRGG
jgi:uncharacterized lipoprotein YajG